MRKVLAGLAASAVGLVPAILVSSPAHAAGNVSDLTISDAGNWEGGTVRFTLTYTGSLPATYSVATADDTATVAATDYTQRSAGNITFPGSGGNNTVVVSVATAADANTADETFFLTATGDDGSKSGIGTIWAASTYPTYTLSGPTAAVTETAITSGAGSTQKRVTITATIDTAMPHDVTIPVATAAASLRAADLRARSDGNTLRDFSALPASAAIVIPAYQYSGTIDVELHDDALDEEETQYFLVQQASAPLGAATNAGTVEVAVTDDDTAPSVRIGDAPAVTEAGTFRFPLTLSAATEKQVTVDWESQDGTALSGSNPATLAGTDYTQVATGVGAGRVTIPQYTTTRTADLTTLGDSLFEGPENVRARLTTATGATLGTPTTGTGVINDDDAAGTGPEVTLTPTSVQEGDSGENVRKIAVTVTSSTYPTPVKIDWKTKDDTARAGSDYKAADGSFIIPANTSTATWTQDIPITVMGDKVLEGTEDFDITLSSTTGTIRNPGDVTISISEAAEADAMPTFNVGDVSVTEGNSGTTMAKIPISLSGASPTDTVFSSTFTASSAVEGGSLAGDNDYDLPADTTATIKAGETGGWLNVPINSDTVYERDQQFSVAITTASSDVTATDTPFVKHVSRITIGNDDAQPSLKFTTGNVTEGQSTQVTGTIEGVSEYPYTLGLTVGGGTPNPATAGADFKAPDALPNVAIAVTRGATGPLTDINGAYTWAFAALEDQIDEPTEAFNVTANETTGVPTGFTPSSGTYKIADDPLDLPPAVSVGDAWVNEKDGSVEVPVDLTFTGEATSTVQTVTIPFWTQDGTAKAGKDYTAVKGTLEVPPGSMKWSVKVPILNDWDVEGDETFTVRIGNVGPLGAAVISGDSTVTIKSDDTNNPVTPTISVVGPAKGAGNATISGKVAANAAVELWGAPIAGNGELKWLVNGKADASGNYRFTRAISTGYRFAVQSQDINSAERAVKVTQNPAFSVSSTKGKVTLSVTGNPKAAGQSVIIQRWSGGKWVNTAWKGTTNAAGWKATYSAKSKTKWTLRAFVAGNTKAGLNPGYSVQKSITIK